MKINPVRNQSGIWKLAENADLRRGRRVISNGIKSANIIGLGYMGLPMAALLASGGLQVIGVDINEKRIASLKKGCLPFKEKGLEPIFKKSFKKISFSSEPLPADAFVISVPTPVNRSRKLDLSFVLNAARSILPSLSKGNLVIVESTVGPGATLSSVKKVLDKSGIDYKLAYCPERAFPGNTIFEMVHNDRIIGGIDKPSTQAASRIYHRFVKGKIFLTDIATAEMVKVVENSYRDVNIAFANEIAKISHRVGVDAREVIELANRHPRVKILSPGPGVGGHCIPIDPWFLVQQGKNDAELIKRSLLVNESMPEFIVELLKKTVRKYRLKVNRVGILGVAYKKNVGDTRETPALKIIQGLESAGFKIKSTDPYAENFEEALFSQKEVLNWADAIIIATDHDEYRKLDFSKFRTRLIVDTRRLLSEKQIKRLKNKKIVSLGKGK